VRKLLAVSLALNVLVFGALAWLGSTSGRARLMRSFLEKRHAQLVSAFEAFALAPDDVVFLGDSITEGGPWEEMFPELRVRDRGIGGDTTAGVLARLEQVTRAQPAKVFLLIGTNDLFLGSSEAEIVANIEEILERLKQETPDTEVYLQSVLPRGADYRARVEALNARLAEVAIERGAGWVDLYPHFLDEQTGAIRAELSNDELHLLGPGYVLWRDQIEALVRAGAEPVEAPAEPAGNGTGTEELPEEPAAEAPPETL
jgi:lysophospholipase L1-like esterase